MRSGFDSAGQFSNCWGSELRHTLSLMKLFQRPQSTCKDLLLNYYISWGWVKGFVSTWASAKFNEIPIKTGDSFSFNLLGCSYSDLLENLYYYTVGSIKHFSNPYGYIKYFFFSFYSVMINNPYNRIHFWQNFLNIFMLEETNLKRFILVQHIWAWKCLYLGT